MLSQLRSTRFQTHLRALPIPIQCDLLFCQLTIKRTFHNSDACEVTQHSWFRLTQTGETSRVELLHELFLTPEVGGLARELFVVFSPGEAPLLWSGGTTLPQVLELWAGFQFGGAGHKAVISKQPLVSKGLQPECRTTHKMVQMDPHPPTLPVPLAHSLSQGHCQSGTVTAIRWRFQVNRVSDCSCTTCKHSGLTSAVIARPLPSRDCRGATTRQQRRAPLWIAQPTDIAGLAKRRPKRGLADNLTRAGCPGSLSCRNQTDAGGGRESWETGRTLAGHSPESRRSTSDRLSEVLRRVSGECPAQSAGGSRARWEE
jgi:hypothetical protein